MNQMFLIWVKPFYFTFLYAFEITTVTTCLTKISLTDQKKFSLAQSTQGVDLLSGFKKKIICITLQLFYI